MKGVYVYMMVMWSWTLVMMVELISGASCCTGACGSASQQCCIHCPTERTTNVAATCYCDNDQRAMCQCISTNTTHDVTPSPTPIKGKNGIDSYSI
jgi:hypothetical protein